MVKEKLRKQREQEREENGELSDALEEDWKELRRERKRMKVGKGNSLEKENGNGQLEDLELDL